MLKKFEITNTAGDLYLTRYILNEYQFLHLIHKSDDDRDFHDHPWDWTSQIISGSYIEHTPEGSQVFTPGDVNVKRATQLHRLEVINGPVVTVVNHGPKFREWGFHTVAGWVSHVDYLNDKFGIGKWNGLS